MLEKNNKAMKIVNKKNKIIKVIGKESLDKFSVDVPGDPSSAAFLQH